MTNGEWLRSRTDEELADFMRRLKLIAMSADRVGMEINTLADLNWLKAQHKAKDEC